MDWLTFLVELAKALGWPFAVVVLVFVLRQSLVKLIPTLRHLKYGDFEADFGEKLEEAEHKADAAHLPAAEPTAALDADAETKALPEPKGRSLPFSIAMSLATETPRAAILEGWLLIERGIIRALRARNINAESLPFRQQVELIRQHNLLPPEAVSLLNDLRALRNVAVHPRDEGPPPTAEQAREFVLLSQRLVQALDANAARPLPEDGSRS